MADIKAKRSTTQVNIESGVYEVSCLECGADLPFEADLDLDNDWTVEVIPCQGCIDKAVKEALDAN